MGGKRIWTRATAHAVLLTLAILAAPALATEPATLCRATIAQDLRVLPAAVEAAAARADEALDRRRAEPARPSDLPLLTIDERHNTQPPVPIPPQLLARYCAIAGEMMRLDPRGNQAQAKQFLVAAINLAHAVGDAATEARAAYHLGLTLLNGEGAGGTNTRGAQRVAATRPTDPSTELSDPAAPPQDDPCVTIEVPVVRGIGPILARAALRCAATRATSAGDTPRAALAQLRLARMILSEAGRSPPRARALRREAADSAQAGLLTAAQIPAPVQRALMTGRLAETLVEVDPAHPALAPAIATLRADTSADPAILAVAAALDGQILLAAGEVRGAAVMFQQAIFHEGQRAQPLRMPSWLLLMARAEPQRRDTLAVAAYRALEAIRPILPLADPLTEESNFAVQMRPVFEAAVASQLTLSRNDTGLAAAQKIVEAYREAELQSAFGASCVPARDPVDPAALRTGEVLLYPILLDDRVELLVAVGGRGSAAGFRRLTGGVATNRASIARLVADVTESLINGGDDRWRSASRTLYDALIKPVEAQLKPLGTLIIIPDGPLRALPFAALLDAQEQFLVERTQIALAPALAYSQPGRDRGKRRLKVVAVALQRDVDLPAGRFARLAGTREEAAAAAGPGGRVVDDFREADLRQALDAGRVDVLHLATHAAFNGRSDRSFIVANGEAIPLADLRGLIGSGRARGDELDLLVLSACETAVGDDLASMGLAGAAVQSGAASAIASLWEVNDTGTVALMKAFYDRYRAGDGKAAALRSAQRALIARGGDLAHPSIWAAFTLLGGWR